MQHRTVLAALAPLVLAVACGDASGPGAPTALVLTTPPAAEAAAGATISGPVVQVRDAAGRGVPGVAVTFTVVAGGGSVAGAPVESDAGGQAAAPPWRLGTTAGRQALRASVPGLAPVEAEAMAVAGGAQALRLDVPPPTAVRSGDPFPTAPVVQLVDRYGNGVARAGVEVEVGLFGGTGASLSAGAVPTDAAGRARFDGLALAGAAGSYTLRFRSGTLVPADAPPLTLEAGPAAVLALVTAPWSLDGDAPLTGQPVVEARDAWGNPDTRAAGVVTVEVAAGSAALTGTAQAPLVDGRAAFAGLGVDGTGPVTLRFAVAGLPPVDAPPFTPGAGRPCPAGPRLGLHELAVGDLVRFPADHPEAPACLDFHLDRDAGESYLVLFEDVPRVGEYGGALFRGPATTAPPFAVEVRSEGASGAALVAAPAVRQLPPGTSHAWDFGAGPVYEAEVAAPPGTTPRARLMRGGASTGLAAVRADIAVGDTLGIFMEGIERLEIPRGEQRAVVRFVSDRLVIAEDVRLATLTRQGGQLNTPLSEADLAAIAAEYAAYGGVQGDRVFDGRFNASIEAAAPPRIVAVHSLMYADNIWGYTYSGGDYFVWDFWVGTDGSTRGLNQHPHRVADHLVSHEIAHLRHWGLVERADRTAVRGNRWLVEGFARHAERWSVAARLLGTDTPSRTDNVVLPRNPAYGNSYFRDAVPTFLQLDDDFAGGYGASSWIFDYLADQVAWRGGDWLEGLLGFLVQGGVPADADAAVAVAGIEATTLGELVTRGRVALFADDLEGFPPLPPWTQYHQYQLRASRPAGSAAAVDPVNAWPRVAPGAAFARMVAVDRGGAWGVVLEGNGATGDGRWILSYPALADGVVSVTRLR